VLAKPAALVAHVLNDPCRQFVGKPHALIGQSPGGRTKSRAHGKDTQCPRADHGSVAAPSSIPHLDDLRERGLDHIIPRVAGTIHRKAASRCSRRRGGRRGIGRQGPGVLGPEANPRGRVRIGTVLASGVPSAPSNTRRYGQHPAARMGGRPDGSEATPGT
jgi:hypothetical protein